MQSIIRYKIILNVYPTHLSLFEKLDKPLYVFLGDSVHDFSVISD